MKAYIASNEPSITAALRACLERLKIDCNPSHVVGHDAITLLPLGDSVSSVPVMFFASRTFGPEEFEILK